MSDQKNYLLNETDIPTRWYNVQADLDVPLAPALHPGTGQPAGPDDFAPLFPRDLIMQEVSKDLIVGFNSHKDVKGALGLAQIPVEGESKKVGEGGGLGDGGR